MTAPLFIIDVFANHLPVLDLESLFSENLVCMDQAVENEPIV